MLRLTDAVNTAGGGRPLRFSAAGWLGMVSAIGADLSAIAALAFVWMDRYGSVDPNGAEDNYPLLGPIALAAVVSLLLAGGAVVLCLSSLGFSRRGATRRTPAVIGLIVAAVPILTAA